jgi:hypothetical protein
MPFQIIYRLIGEEKPYRCHVTYGQYKNFKKSPGIKECLVVKRNQKDLEEYRKEMQNALNLAVKNDTSHIHMMSKNI